MNDVPRPTRPDPFTRTHDHRCMFLYPVAMAAAGGVVGLVLAILLTR